MINSMNKIRKGYISNNFLINKQSYFCEIFVYGLTKLENKAKNHVATLYVTCFYSISEHEN